MKHYTTSKQNEREREREKERDRHAPFATSGCAFQGVLPPAGIAEQVDPVLLAFERPPVVQEHIGFVHITAVVAASNGTGDVITFDCTVPAVCVTVVLEPELIRTVNHIARRRVEHVTIPMGVDDCDRLEALCVVGWGLVHLPGSDPLRVSAGGHAAAADERVETSSREVERAFGFEPRQAQTVFTGAHDHGLLERVVCVLPQLIGTHHSVMHIHPLIFESLPVHRAEAPGARYLVDSRHATFGEVQLKVHLVSEASSHS